MAIGRSALSSQQPMPMNSAGAPSTDISPHTATQSPRSQSWNPITSAACLSLTVVGCPSNVLSTNSAWMHRGGTQNESTTRSLPGAQSSSSTPPLTLSRQHEAALVRFAGITVGLGLRDSECMAPSQANMVHDLHGSPPPYVPVDMPLSAATVMASTDTQDTLPSSSSGPSYSRSPAVSHDTSSNFGVVLETIIRNLDNFPDQRALRLVIHRCLSLHPGYQRADWGMALTRCGLSEANIAQILQAMHAASGDFL